MLIFISIRRSGYRIFLRRGAPLRNGVTDFFAEYQLYCAVVTLGRNMISLITNETCFAIKVFTSDGALRES